MDPTGSNSNAETSSTRWCSASAATSVNHCGTAICSSPATPATPCPPTGAKGLNLAFADVRVLFEGVESYVKTGSRELLDQYSDRALQRIWKAQNFSYWMTSMLHERPDTNPFERKRQLGELSAVVNSRYGSAYLAEAYTGWPAG